MAKATIYRSSTFQGERLVMDGQKVDIKPGLTAELQIMDLLGVQLDIQLVDELPPEDATVAEIEQQATAEKRATIQHNIEQLQREQQALQQKLTRLQTQLAEL